MNTLIFISVICFGVMTILAGIRIFNIYKRTGLRSHLWFLVGAMMGYVGALGSLVVLFTNIPEIGFDNIKFSVLFAFFSLIAICGVVLGQMGLALMLTKDAGVLKELRKRTSLLQWMLGDVPSIEKRLYPPIGKKWIWIATGISIMIVPGALLALFSSKTTGSGITGVVTILILNLILGVFVIVFSMRYLRGSEKGKSGVPGSRDNES